jgi:single-strand DNA-binding protein
MKMNRVILIGNLSKDPELSTTSNGISVCKFDIAVRRRFENASGEREADFFKIIAWRGLADNCGKFLSKGKKAAVVGSLQTRTYDDKYGVKRYVTEIVADEVEFLSPKQEQGEILQRNEASLKPVTDDDLPF